MLPPACARVFSLPLGFPSPSSPVVAINRFPNMPSLHGHRTKKTGRKKPGNFPKAHSRYKYKQERAACRGRNRPAVGASVAWGAAALGRLAGRTRRKGEGLGARCRLSCYFKSFGAAGVFTGCPAERRFDTAWSCLRKAEPYTRARMRELRMRAVILLPTGFLWGDRRVWTSC